MNEVEFNALVFNGSREELKAYLKVLRVAVKQLAREESRVVAKQRLVVEALARRQEEAL